jgi:hypothetical protein
MSAKNLGRVQCHINEILGPNIRLEVIERNQNELQRFTGPGLCLEDIEFALQYLGIGFVDRERFCIELDLA